MGIEEVFMRFVVFEYLCLVLLAAMEGIIKPEIVIDGDPVTEDHWYRIMLWEFEEWLSQLGQPTLQEDF